MAWIISRRAISWSARVCPLFYDYFPVFGIELAILVWLSMEPLLLLDLLLIRFPSRVRDDLWWVMSRVSPDRNLFSVSRFILNIADLALRMSRCLL